MDFMRCDVRQCKENGRKKMLRDSLLSFAELCQKRQSRYHLLVSLNFFVVKVKVYIYFTFVSFYVFVSCLFSVCKSTKSKILEQNQYSYKTNLPVMATATHAYLLLCNYQLSCFFVEERGESFQEKLSRDIHNQF